MKLYFTFLFITLLHCNLHARYSNSFIVIQDTRDSYGPKILPLETFEYFKNEIRFDTLQREKYNGSYSIIKEGFLVKYYNRVNLDSTFWGKAKDSILNARYLMYNTINLPFNYALLFADSLRDRRIYFKTEIDLNTQYQYLLDLNPRFVEFPDTAQLSFNSKKQIGEELAIQLKKKFTEVFPNLDAELNFDFAFAWEPRIRIYLRLNEFEFDRLRQINVKFITENKIIWRSVRFTIYDY
ncbi:MAG: hypothetical protein IPO32_17110 [Crocinitomicaceae bacterium]|jgi:hypothetical protein|nr:hypothetical protein [Crocinitomicaceae bacterium]